MLDFCGANSITADVEVIPIQKVNEASILHRYGVVEERLVFGKAETFPAGLQAGCRVAENSRAQDQAISNHAAQTIIL